VVGCLAESKAIRLGDRYVTVKELVEKKVKSDLAIWPFSFKEAGDDLASLYAKTEADRKTVLQFLNERGLQPAGTSKIDIARSQRLRKVPRSSSSNAC